MIISPFLSQILFGTVILVISVLCIKERSVAVAIAPKKKAGYASCVPDFMDFGWPWGDS